MEFFQFAGEGINIGGGEVSSRSRRKEAGPFPGSEPRLVTSSPTIHQPSHNVEHIQCPATHLDGNIFQRFDVTELFPDFARWCDPSFRNDRNPGIYRDTIQGKIASHPPCP